MKYKKYRIQMTDDIRYGHIEVEGDGYRYDSTSGTLTILKNNTIVALIPSFIFMTVSDS